MSIIPSVEKMKFMTKELENSEEVFLKVKNIIRDDEWLITSSVKDIERTKNMFKEKGLELSGRLKTQIENSMRENKVFYEMKESFERQRKLRSDNGENYRYRSWGELHDILCEEHGHSDDLAMSEECEECWDRYDEILSDDPRYLRVMNDLHNTP